jgi:hypothetical protein
VDFAAEYQERFPVQNHLRHIPVFLQVWRIGIACGLWRGGLGSPGPGEKDKRKEGRVQQSSAENNSSLH